MLVKMRELQKVEKKPDAEKHAWAEVIQKRVECDINYKTKALVPTKKHVRHISVHENVL